MRKKSPVRSRSRNGVVTFFELAADLIGSVDDPTMPRDLSARRKQYLKKRSYGKKRRRESGVKLTPPR